MTRLEPTTRFTRARPTEASRSSDRRPWSRIPWLLTVAIAAPGIAQDSFTINFRALGGIDNPHPPIPQCQVIEEHDPPYPDSTGDCLHLLATSNGQPIECLEEGLEECPVLTIGAPPPGLFFATTSGLGVVDYDITEPDACPLHCSPDWLLGENCGTIPGDPCFCDPNGCVGTPTLHGDWKDGLDFTHDTEPSEEEIRVAFGVPTLVSDIAFWRASLSQLSLQRSDCPGPLLVNYREGAVSPLSSGDGVFTLPGGGLYLPQNAQVAIANPAFRPASTNDRIALQELGVTLVAAQEEPWRTGCPYFAVPFDRGFTDITSAEWLRTDDDALPGTDVWTSTMNVSGTHCGLPNLAGGAAGAVCFRSEPGRPGFDTSMISRPIDLSLAARPSLRFLVSLETDDELLEVLTSTDGGQSWILRSALDQSQPGGSAILVPLADLAYTADVLLRLRYHDPNGTDSSTDHVVVDDILVFSDEGLFSDGFESGDTSRWQGLL